MYPYPSGDGLHVGHVEGYTATDILSRAKRMQGYEVLHPMGWDAMGLPTENHAIKTGENPHEVTDRNAEVFRGQCKRMGFSIDWDREIDTSKKEYYKFTQQIFLKLFDKGLAYKAEGPVNWCGDCQTALSNDQVKGGCCERCNAKVDIKKIEQWYLKITDYADRLLEDIDKLDWPESTKEKQRNWIGRTEGYEMDMEVEGEQNPLGLFTNAPEALLNSTHITVAQDHPQVQSLIADEERLAVEEYMATHTLNEMDRKTAEPDAGVVTGKYVINPLTGDRMEIRISNTVLMDEFGGVHLGQNEVPPEEGSAPSRDEVLSYLGDKAKKAVHYKMRDWLVSRERYWGAPIPIIHCDNCGDQPVPEDQLPVELPEMDDFKPTGTPPLARVPEFFHTNCPHCNGAATREAKTLDTFVDSAWYYMRYADPQNQDAIGEPNLLERWMPVDYYVGGSDHATGHLLYARFITKFLYDLGEVPFDEPFTRLFHQGMIMGEDGRKMGKRYGNGVRPEDVADEYGSDALRLAEMFFGPLEQQKNWNTQTVAGTKKFVDRVFRIMGQVDASAAPTLKEQAAIDALVVSITEHIDKGRFNVAVSDFMTFVKNLDKSKPVSKAVAETFLKLLAPFAPFVTEELWEKMGNGYSIHKTEWPKPTGVAVPTNQEDRSTTKVPISINGKNIGVFDLPNVDMTLDELIQVLSEGDAEIAAKLEGKSFTGVVYKIGRVVNFRTQ
jgi:leucyl-tRNA synthetase